MASNETVFNAYRGETVQTDSGESQNMFGCDGSYHAVWKDLLETGQEFPTSYTVENLGPCDGSCAAGLADNDGSGFLHAAPKPELISG